MAQQNFERGGEMVDKLVGIRRVAKTVKGGRRMAMSALVVVGDEAGRVGFGKGKAKEVPDAVRKATDSAKRAMVRVNMRHGRTIHHEIEGRFGGAKVILKPAVPGTGIIAGGPMRAVFEAMGIRDIVAKSLGSNNPFNMIQATFDAFSRMETPRSVAAKRGMKPADLVLYREESAKGDTDAKADSEAQAAGAKQAKAQKDAKSAHKGDMKGKPAKGKPNSAKSGDGKTDAAGDRPRRSGKFEKKAESTVKVERKGDAVKQNAKGAAAAPSATRTPITDGTANVAAVVTEVPVTEEESKT